MVFPEGEYAHPSGGTVETLQAITRDDIVAVHRKYYRPDNAVLIFSGSITAEQGKAFAEKFFGGLDNRFCGDAKFLIDRLIGGRCAEVI